ncbi:MAG: FkbM family methyltransferase [Hydrotalea sp.]|nr:FkbM family methyltransferase [Hydrotalea sp.]
MKSLIKKIIHRLGYSIRRLDTILNFDNDPGAVLAFLTPQEVNRNDSWSQEGEDLIIADRIFSNRTKGFYINIGCHHPFRFSNTYSLYKKGFHGINIDIDNRSIALCKKYLPKDKSLLTFIGGDSTPQVIEFTFFEDGALNTADPERIDKLEKLGFKKLYKRKRKKTHINELLRKHHVKEIDFLNIDIEGLDKDVIMSLDFTKWRPLVVAIETGFKNKDNSVKDFLEAKNYHLISKLYNSEIYCDINLYETL